MDETKREMIRQWRAMAQDNYALIADAAAGLTKRRLTTADVAEAKAEAARWEALADAMEAAQND